MSLYSDTRLFGSCEYAMVIDFDPVGAEVGASVAALVGASVAAEVGASVDEGTSVEAGGGADVAGEPQAARTMLARTRIDNKTYGLRFTFLLLREILLGWIQLGAMQGIAGTIK
jgi:hypothetical protein